MDGILVLLFLGLLCCQGLLRVIAFALTEPPYYHLDDLEGWEKSFNEWKKRRAMKQRAKKHGVLIDCYYVNPEYLKGRLGFVKCAVNPTAECDVCDSYKSIDSGDGKQG